MTAGLAYLTKLNPGQRRLAAWRTAACRTAACRTAAYGVQMGLSTKAGPLLVIAGAGSGKNQHARASGCPSHCQRGRSAPYPAVDVSPAGGIRDDLPRDIGAGQSREIEEERRALYVAMTHAGDDRALLRRRSYLTRGQNRLGERHAYTKRSRFIQDALLTLFASMVRAMAGNAAARQITAGQGLRIDVAAMRHGLWRRKDIANV